MKTCRHPAFLAFFFCIPALFWGAACAHAARVAKPSFNKAHGFYSSSFSVTITSATSGAAIRYTTDGSKPSGSSGISYSGPVTISRTTCLRACASKSGYTDSQVQTQTYIFVNDVVNQTGPSGWPSTWGAGASWLKYSGWADYHMDTSINATDVKNSLKALPSICVAMPKGDMFNNGQLYGGGGGKGDQNTITKEASCELIPAGGGTGFQLDCMMKSHTWPTIKRSLRLLFKSRDGGPAQANYPVFESAPNNSGNAATTFGKLILRAGMNYSWGGYPVSAANTVYARDQFARDTQIAMSGRGAHGTYVHLYINGLYWGLYNLVERPDARWAATYFGGAKSDYDSINHGYGAPSYQDGGLVSGSITAWNTFHNYVANNNLGNTTPYNWVAAHCDLTLLADYLILNAYGNTGDWPRGNYYAVIPNGGKLFYAVWDAEISMLPSGGWPVAHQAYKDGSYKVGLLAKKLLQNAKFKQILTTRVKLHCQGTGVLTDSKALARYDNICAAIEKGIDAEAARWGDHMVRADGQAKYTKAKWRTQRDNIRNKIPGAANRLINAFKNAGWWDESGTSDPPAAPSNLAAAALDQNRIRVTWTDNSNNESGFKLDRRTSGETTWVRVVTTGANVESHTDTGLTAGTKYYYQIKAYNAAGNSADTAVANATTPAAGGDGIAYGATWRYRLGTAEPASPLPAWHALDFDDSGWANGPAAFGYGDGPYGTDITAGMQGNCTTLYLRKDFPLEVPAAVSAIQLSTLYDDGFIVWINGQELARVNAPGTAGSQPACDATATTAVNDGTAWTQTYAGSALPALRTDNIVAVMVLNAGLASSDLTFDAELVPVRDAVPAGETDTDADRVPDAWETAELSGTGADPEADPDEDGFSNIDEYIIGGDGYLARAILCSAPGPAAPGNLSAAALSASHIGLSWSDNSANEDQFKIDRRESGTTGWIRIATLGTNTTAHSDTGLSAATKFYYKVKAWNAAGSGDLLADLRLSVVSYQ